MTLLPLGLERLQGLSLTQSEKRNIRDNHYFYFMKSQILPSNVPTICGPLPAVQTQQCELVLSSGPYYPRGGLHNS